MLQIRQSFFETNSSSVHALIISKTEGCRLPSTVNLSEDSDHGDTQQLYVAMDGAGDSTGRFVWRQCDGEWNPD